MCDICAGKLSVGVRDKTGGITNYTCPGEGCNPRLSDAAREKIKKMIHQFGAVPLVRQEMKIA